MRRPRSYYGITSTNIVAVPRSRDRVVYRPQWYILSGPYPTAEAAKEAAYTEIERNPDCIVRDTMQKNLLVVPRSKLRLYRIDEFQIFEQIFAIRD